MSSVHRVHTPVEVYGDALNQGYYQSKCQNPCQQEYGFWNFYPKTDFLSIPKLYLLLSCKFSLSFAGRSGKKILPDKPLLKFQRAGQCALQARGLFPEDRNRAADLQLPSKKGTGKRRNFCLFFSGNG